MDFQKKILLFFFHTNIPTYFAFLQYISISKVVLTKKMCSFNIFLMYQLQLSNTKSKREVNYMTVSDSCNGKTAKRKQSIWQEMVVLFSISRWPIVCVARLLKIQLFKRCIESQNRHDFNLADIDKSNAITQLIITINLHYLF